jgi:hypothetical protein
MSIARLLPWALCLCLAAILAWTWVTRAQGRRDVAGELTKPGLPDAHDPRGADGSVALLKVCTERLAAQAAQTCAHCPTAAPTLPSCLALPAVRLAMETATTRLPSRTDGGAAPSGGVSGEPPPPRSVTAERFNRRLVSDVMRVTDAEAARLREYVCAAHALRTRHRADLESLLSVERAPERAAVDALTDDGQREREAVLADLKRFLGEERYSRLRALGGLGLLASSFACTDDPGAD